MPSELDVPVRRSGSAQEGQVTSGTASSARAGRLKTSALSGQVRASTALATASRDGAGQRLERGHDARLVGLPTSAAALRKPVGRRPMAPSAVAARTGTHQVLRPGRPALDAGNDVLDGRLDEAGPDLSAAPDACRPISLEDEGEHQSAGCPRATDMMAAA
jgi:hypothetical protein